VQVGADNEQVNQYIQTYIENRHLPAEPAHGSRSGAGHAWNIPARNPGFTGREQLLAAVREALAAGDKAVVRALHGMWGVGKTQLATEYAHRFSDSYDIAWWGNSEQGWLIGGQFAALGAALGCVEAGAGMEVVRPVVLAELHRRSRWLLVFDNAGNPADITPWLPGGCGHVLITSREQGWAEIAAAVEVDVLARAETVEMLQSRVTGLTGADADRLAVELGDLPLAVTQAAGFMVETGMAAGEYLDLLATRAGQLLAEGTPGSYPRSLAATTQLIADRLADEDPAAAELASLCAFLAPEPVPDDLFPGAASKLPGALAARTADPLAWRQTLGRLTRQALARIDHRGLVMHRLTQAILRDQLSAAQAATARACTEAVLVASSPGDPSNPVTWTRWAQLMPHLLVADLAVGNPALRWMACRACWYLLMRGDTRAARDLARDLHQHWRDRFGDDDETTLEAAHFLGWALQEMDRPTEARNLTADTLDRARRVIGRDHPHTLTYATQLAIAVRSLGEVQAARDLDQDTLKRRRRVLGDEHPNTLRSAGNLARDLYSLGEVQAARDLDQDTLERMRRVLGDDHPDTLGCAHNLAHDLRALGEVQAARDLDQDTLEHRRRILGDDHPDTLRSANNLAEDSVSVALGHLRSGKPEVAAAIFEVRLNESPNDSEAYNNYGFCILPNNPEAALDSLTKASQLLNHGKLITLANTVLALHLIGRDAEAVALGSSGTVATLPEASGWMWIVDDDHQLKLSDRRDVRIYLDELIRHIQAGCSTAP
jgi:hypothetical protein